MNRDPDLDYLYYGDDEKLREANRVNDFCLSVVIALLLFIAFLISAGALTCHLFL